VPAIFGDQFFLQENANQVFVHEYVTTTPRTIHEEAPGVRSGSGKLIAASYESGVLEVAGLTNKTGVAMITLQWGFERSGLFGDNN
jgi:hypothetical protein